MSDWSVSQILDATRGTLVKGAVRRELPGFSIDTRTIGRGEIFFALKGEQTDGHMYISRAVEQGASAVVCSEVPDDLLNGSTDTSIIKVADTLLALQNCARFHRKRHGALFIGVTGSNGKTTTKDMLKALFDSMATTWATHGNLNNHIGLPLSVCRIPPSARTAVVEMGMSHPGEIRFLCSLAQPDSALITNVGPAHIGNLKTLDNIARAKAEILEGLQPHQTAIFNGDSPYLGLFRETTKAHVVTFGTGETCDLKISEIRSEPEGVEFKIEFKGRKRSLKMKLLGKHNAFNAAAALATFFSHGGRLENGLMVLSNFEPPGARMQSFSSKGVRLILDCYNANPASMTEAIEYLKICEGRKIAVLGDMKELGDQSDASHRNLGKHVAESGIDILIAVGNESALTAQGAADAGMVSDKLYHCNSLDEATNLLNSVAAKADTILLKASRGMHFERIVAEIWPGVKCDLH